MQILAMLGLKISAIGMSRVIGVPVMFPIKKRHYLLNIKRGRLGKLTQIDTTGESISSLKL